MKMSIYFSNLKHTQTYHLQIYAVIPIYKLCL